MRYVSQLVHELKILGAIVKVAFDLRYSDCDSVIWDNGTISHYDKLGVYVGGSYGRQLRLPLTL